MLKIRQKLASLETRPQGSLNAASTRQVLTDDIRQTWPDAAIETLHGVPSGIVRIRGLKEGSDDGRGKGGKGVYRRRWWWGGGEYDCQAYMSGQVIILTGKGVTLGLSICE